MSQPLSTKPESRIKLHTDCSICNYRVDSDNENAFVIFRCRIRSLMDECFDRKYDDTLWLCLNNRAVNNYMEVFDGSMDVLAEPLNLGKALSSPKFLFWAILGYWLSLHTGMGVMFRKRI